MKRKRSYVGHEQQNEMLFANQVLRRIITQAKSCGPLGIMIDGCQEGGTEHISIYLRYCTKYLTVSKKVVGLYATSKSDAESLTNIILDVLLRLDLLLCNIVGEAYDGASVMSGNISGVQQRIREKALMAG